jgi:tetratricopeptide (TPR) repeat protein
MTLFLRHRYLLPMLLIGLFLGSAFAQSPALTIDADQQMAFADHLFQSGQFRRAAEEYQRFAFFFPDHPLASQAIFKSGQGYASAGDPATAITIYKTLAKSTGDRLSPLGVEACFETSRCYEQMKQPNQAILQLHNLIALSDDIQVKDRANYRIAWIYLEAADWNAARRALDQISPGSSLPVTKLKDALSKSREIPYKSPPLAGSLSIVPGMGQLYLGRYQDAFVAFTVNAGVIWAACESFDKDLNALGIVLSMVGIGFYTGNIYGAVSGAHKYNRIQRRNFTEQLKRYANTGFQPALRIGDDQLLLTFSYHF